MEIPPALRETFLQYAGLNITVRRTINDRDERRTYSIVTPSSGNTLEARHQDANRRPDVRRYRRELARRRHARSRHADGPLPHGDRCRAPFSYVAFAGVGKRASHRCWSLASDILAKEPLSRFTLIYGNRSISRTMFLEETLALKNRYIDRLSLHFVMSREPQQTELLNGRIDGKKVIELAQSWRKSATRTSD